MGYSAIRPYHLTMVDSYVDCHGFAVLETFWTPLITLMEGFCLSLSCGVTNSIAHDIYKRHSLPQKRLEIFFFSFLLLLMLLLGNILTSEFP